MEARSSESNEQDVEPPLSLAAAQLSPSVQAPQATGPLHAALRDVHISGDCSPTFSGPARNVIINYNLYQPGATEVPMTTEVTREGRTDDPLKAVFRNMVCTMFQARGVVHTKEEFSRMLLQYEAVMDRVEDGSVTFVLRISSREGLDKLWTDFSSGELARRLTELFITNELTTEDKSQIAIRATILQSDYERGCKFFEELQETEMKEMVIGKAKRSALGEISRDHPECIICQERYKEPKVLDCQHSFCEQCLVKYHNTQHRDSREILCPVCRQKTQLPEIGIQGLKTNFHIIGLAEVFAMHEELASLSKTKQLCEVCAENNGVLHRCFDCVLNVCAHCREIHQRFPALFGHIIVAFDEIRAGKVTQQKYRPKCKNHPDKATLFFCTTCKQLICQDCTILDHCKPEYVYIDCDSAASMYKQSMAQLFSSSEKTLEDVVKSREAVLRVKHKLHKAIEETTSEVKARTSEIKALLSAQESRLLDQIGRLQKDRDQQLDEYEKKIGVMTEKIQYSLETAKYVTSTASNSKFLSLYPTISKNLSFLASRDPPVVNERLSFLKFKRSQGVDDIDLGELQPEGQWELLREFGTEGSGPGEFNGALCVAGLEPDEIAVADYGNQRVVIYNTEGYLKSTIPVQIYPQGIAATRAHDCFVVVCSPEPCMKVFSKHDGTWTFKSFLVHPSETGMTSVSVAVKMDGTIIVGDTERRVLTEHNPTDGSLIRTIPVQTVPFYIAVDCMERAVISNWGPDVYVTDGNATTEFLIKPTIEGKRVRYCTGVYCDHSGIYIAMNNGPGTGHIHHYDTSGRFLDCIAKGLHDPRGIALTADGQQLVVADYFSVKIYQVG